MTKARLIKREEAVAIEAAKNKRQVKKPIVKKTMEAMTEWVASQRTERQDPRKAFAALFARTQS